jgi:hypothetical protein
MAGSLLKTRQENGLVLFLSWDTSVRIDVERLKCKLLVDNVDGPGFSLQL